MDIKKLCKFNFKRQETTAGHCTNVSCKFLHPDPPADADDPLWCPDDHKEDGGCLNFHCSLYHPNSCRNSQLRKFIKIRSSYNELSRRISIRSESPSYETRRHDHEVSPRNQPRKRSYDRSESPVAKRKKLSTKMEQGRQYKITKEFSKEDVSSKYRHHEKLSVCRNELVTFVSMCDPSPSCDNYCSFARLRNQFGEEGFVPVKCIDDDESVPLTCPLAPACEDLLFTDQEALHSHLCLHHFHQELQMHLKSSNRCPLCEEKMQSDDLILHYGSAPHHKVASLLTKGIGKAVESFKEQNDLLLQETVMKIKLGHQESIKEIRQREENKIVSLQEKLTLSGIERDQLIEDKRGIETERDDLDSEKIDCINEIRQIVGDRLPAKISNLKSIADVVRQLINEDSSTIKEDDRRFSSGNQTNYQEAESSLKTYHSERENTSGQIAVTTEGSGKKETTSINDKIITELSNSLSKATADLSDMEKERDELDEKLETSEQMRKEDSVRFTKQLETLKTELAAHGKMYSELQLKLKKKDNIIKNIIPLIENHLETS